MSSNSEKLKKADNAMSDAHFQYMRATTNYLVAKQNNSGLTDHELNVLTSILSGDGRITLKFVEEYISGIALN